MYVAIYQPNGMSPENQGPVPNRQSHDTANNILPPSLES
jgi:hypothetical protein